MNDVQTELMSVWRRAHAEIKDECGADKKKLAVAELLALHTLARQLLPQPKTTPRRGRSLVKR